MPFAREEALKHQARRAQSETPTNTFVSPNTEDRKRRAAFDMTGAPRSKVSVTARDDATEVNRSEPPQLRGTYRLSEPREASYAGDNELVICDRGARGTVRSKKPRSAKAVARQSMSPES